MPGDTSASERYFAADLTEPFVLESDGTMAVPTGPGIGGGPLANRLEGDRGAKGGSWSAA
jgi:O-succinylbenzoate synthase